MSKPLSRFKSFVNANRRPRSRKGMAWVGLEPLENRALLSAGPTITSITQAPNPAIRSELLTITATGVVDTGGLIRSVTFYLDVNHDGVFDHGDERLGNGRLVAGTNNYAIKVHTKSKKRWALGNNSILAVAKDSNGNENAPFEGSIVLDNHPPHISKLEVVHKIAAAGNAVTLKALHITDPDAKIASVAFFLDSNNNGTPDSGELLGTDSNKKGGWTFTGNLPTTLPTTGTVTFLAVATGTDGTPGTVATVTVPVDAPPTITTLSTNAIVVADSDIIGRGVPVIITAAGVADTDGTVKNVGFFFDANHDGILDAGDKSLGNGKRVVVNSTTTNFDLTTKMPASTPTGATTFFAVPVDNKGQTGFDAPAASDGSVTGIPASVRVTLGPAIGSLTSDSPTVVLGGAITLTANNVVAEPGKTITAVEFFLDSNGNGKLDSKDKDLGSGALTIDNSNHHNFSLVTNAPASTSTSGETFFAVARDGTGAIAASSTSAVHVFFTPSIGTLTSSVGTVAPGGSLTLTASNITLLTGKTVSFVEFFVDTNGDGKFEFGTDTDLGTGQLINGSYQLATTAPSTLPVGNRDFFAVAVESDNAQSPAAIVQVVIRPSIGSLTGNALTVVPGDNLTLTASGIAVGSGGAVGNVEFFLDANGDGQFELDTDTDLGAGTLNGSGNYQLTTTVAAGTPLGTQTYFAVLSDNQSPPNTSPPATLVVTVIDPTIATLIPSVTTAAPGDSVTLTASGISVGTGTVQNVQFFIDTNNNGVFDAGIDTSLGTITTPTNGNYVLAFNLPQDTPPGVTKFFAVATNANNISGPAVAAQLTVS